MNSTHVNPSHLAPGRTSSGALSSVLLIVTALLAFSPVFILGPAIGWPASLGNPAAQQLQAIFDHAHAVQRGYASYLLYSVLLLPAFAALLAHRPIAATWQTLVLCLVALSVLARSVGILRWQTVMPELATTWSQADPSARAVVELQFNAINSWGGGIGELLGVSLFMGMALVVMAVAAWQSRWPRWISVSALLCALLLLALATPLVGLESPVPVAVAVSALSLWMLAVGISNALRSRG